MTKQPNRILAIIGAVAAISAGIWNGASSSHASVFHHWKVYNVAYHDVLNVRQYPSSKSSIVSFFKNGAPLQLTGTCTGGVHLNQLAHLAKWEQKQAVRYEWCQVWAQSVGGTGFVEGWVYGKFIRPGA